MKLKPIEPGCNAIVINQDATENRGKHVVAELLVPTSGEFRHNGRGYINEGAKNGARMWKVSGPRINGLFGGTVVESGWACVEEKDLMRIDGDDFLDEDNPYAVKDKDRHHA